MDPHELRTLRDDGTLTADRFPRPDEPVVVEGVAAFRSLIGLG